MKLYVGNLSYNTTDATLNDLFAPFGQVESARVITDRAQEFDKIPAGYSGPLYLEISPRTFPIVVRRGSRLSQVRFRKGNALLGDSELLCNDFEHHDTVLRHA